MTNREELLRNQITALKEIEQSIREVRQNNESELRELLFQREVIEKALMK